MFSEKHSPPSITCSVSGAGADPGSKPLLLQDSTGGLTALVPGHWDEIPSSSSTTASDSPALLFSCPPVPARAVLCPPCQCQAPGWLLALPAALSVPWEMPSLFHAVGIPLNTHCCVFQTPPSRAVPKQVALVPLVPFSAPFAPVCVTSPSPPQCGSGPALTAST